MEEVNGQSHNLLFSKHIRELEEEYNQTFERNGSKIAVTKAR
jgi:hypothetical protein